MCMGVFAVGWGKHFAAEFVTEKVYFNSNTYALDLFSLGCKGASIKFVQLTSERIVLKSRHTWGSGLKV